MPSRLSTLIRDLERRALGDGESDGEGLRRRLLIFACGLMSLGVMVWLAIYWSMGIQFSTTVPLAYQLLSVASLAWFLASGNFPVFRFSQLSLFLFMPFVMQWSIGNSVSASGVILWALLAPVGAAVTHGARESIPWFIAYLVLTLVSGLFDWVLASGRDPGLPLQTIALFFMLNFAAISAIVYLVLRYSVQENARIRVRLDDEHRQLVREREKSERLLLNILPPHIAERLKQDESIIADGHTDVTVMFADLVNFTRLTEEMAPQQMVVLLNRVFSSFDALVEGYGLEKIKTIGDAYMVAGGLDREPAEYTADMAHLALEMRSMLAQHPGFMRYHLGLHIGIATGPVVAGVIGTKRFIFDLWGDTVNIASRLTSEGVGGYIQVDRVTYNRLRSEFEFEGPITLAIKGKGEMPVYRLRGKIAAVP